MPTVPSAAPNFTASPAMNASYAAENAFGSAESFSMASAVCCKSYSTNSWFLSLSTVCAFHAVGTRDDTGPPAPARRPKGPASSQVRKVTHQLRMQGLQASPGSQRQVRMRIFVLGTVPDTAMTCPAQQCLLVGRSGYFLAEMATTRFPRFGESALVWDGVWRNTAL